MQFFASFASSDLRRNFVRRSSSAASILVLATGAFAQFTDTNPGMATSAFECVVAGDYDQDGSVDVIVMGSGSHDIAFTTLYRNVGGAFVDSGIPLVGLSPSAASATQCAAWGDFDGDGDLDLAMTGLTTGGVPTTIVYRNDGSTFTPVAGNFLGVFAGTVSWADYDGDGDLDLLVTGITAATAGAPAVTRLYRNDAGTFTSVAHPFQNAYLGPVAWGDYDGDGRIDVLICGADSGGAVSATLWRNLGGTFVDAGANLPGLDLGFAKWGDFDGDGDLDLLFGGNSNSGFISRIYRNDAGTLTDIGANLVPVIWSSAAWGDYDNDGDLDAMVIGYDPVAQAARSTLYRNVGGNFTDSGFAFHNVYLGCVSWLDSDKDGDLDLLLSGNEVGSDILRLYRNDSTCPAPKTYCTAKTNSLGCTPSISLNAAPSATAGSGAVLRTTNVVGKKNGLYFHSTSGAIGAPFHGGFLCVKSPTKRHALLTSGGTPGTCDGVFSEDLNAYIAAGTDPNLVAGATIWIQCWSRDPGDPFTDSLSNAVSALICP